MSWLYDDQDLVQEPPPAPDESSTAPSTAHDFELFHEQVAPIDVGQSDLPPATGEQGIKHVRVRNLQWWTNENTLRDILSECGVIKSVEFEASMKNGKSLGIANIEFETSDAALRAIDLIDNRDVDGKPVNASLLVVEDVKVSGPHQPQLQRQLPPNQFRKQVSPKRPAKSPSRIMNSTVRDTPTLDPPRQAKVSSRENSSAKSVRQTDHRHHDTDRNPISTRDTDQDGAHSHSNSVPDGKDRDQTSRPRSSSSRHGHQTSHRHDHHHPGSSHKDQDRALHGSSSSRGARSETAKIDSHHCRDVDFRRAPPPSDSKYSSHSRHTETDRAGSRGNLRPDHDRSNHRSSHHRDYDAGRASRRMQQDYSKEHGSSADRYRDRHRDRDRVEVHTIRDRHSHYSELDHRPRKKRR